jgi:hypothetical protein
MRRTDMVCRPYERESALNNLVQTRYQTTKRPYVCGRQKTTVYHASLYCLLRAVRPSGPEAGPCLRDAPHFFLPLRRRLDNGNELRRRAALLDGLHTRVLEPPPPPPPLVLIGHAASFIPY